MDDTSPPQNASFLDHPVYRTQESVLCVPSPPQPWTSPPTLDSSGFPDLSFLSQPTRTFTTSGFPDADFLTAIPPSSMTSSSKYDTARNWKYEDRRTAQQILPFMLLGPDTVARDKDFLVRNGISMVMAVRNVSAAQVNLLNPKAPRDLGLESIAIDVSNSQQLIAAFPIAIRAVNAHLNARFLSAQAKSPCSTIDLHPNSNATPPPFTPSGRVLIFCETGNERSAAVVSAYIMAMYNLTIDQAVQTVQASRFCVALDYQLGNVLRSYRMILEAQRNVFETMVSVTRVEEVNEPREPRSVGTIEVDMGTASMAELDFGTAGLLMSMTMGMDVGKERRKKRGLEMDEEMETEDQSCDSERFMNRAGQAPFSDALEE